MAEIDYGKKIITESYFGGKKKEKIEYQIPMIVNTKAMALGEVIKSFDLITNKTTHKLTITIEADPRTHEFKMVTKQYSSNEN